MTTKEPKFENKHVKDEHADKVERVEGEKDLKKLVRKEESTEKYADLYEEEEAYNMRYGWGV